MLIIGIKTTSSGVFFWNIPSTIKQVEQSWGEEGLWKEFTSNQIISIPPNEDHPHEGYLIIACDELPDPLIGGC